MNRRTTTAVLVILVLLTAVSVTLAQQVLPLMMKPVNTSPTNGTTVNTTTPVLEWSGSADTYKVIVKDALGQKVFKASGAQNEFCTLTGGGGYYDCAVNPADSQSNLPNGTLTWKVKAKQDGQKAKSDTTTFTVNYPGSVSLTSPDNGAKVSGSPLLQWNKLGLPGIEYKVKIKHNLSGVKSNTDWLAANVVCGDESCAYETDLGFGTYKWSVVARRPLPNGIYTSKSEKRTFTIEPPIQG